MIWLYAAADPATNRLLHVRLFPTRTHAATEMFLSDLRENRHVDDAIVLVDGAPWLQAACHRHGPDSTMSHVESGTPSNVSSEK